MDQYSNYKTNYVRNYVFDPASSNLTGEIEFAPLKVVQIYFDTATFDEIEKDVKVTMEAALGLVGGTMGLLTGFSILSGVEIIYYVLKFFMSLRIPKAKRA